MDRSALLKLIHKDLNELQLLLEGMEGYGEIPDPIIKLAKGKAEQLKENINSLPGEIRVAIHEQMEVDEVVDASGHIDSEAQTSDELPAEEPFQINDKPQEVIHEETTEDLVEEAPVQPGMRNDVEPEPVPDEPDHPPKTDVEGKEEEPDAQPAEEEKPEPVAVKKKTITVLGDKLNPGEKVIDRIKKDISGSLGARLEGSPVSDLKKAININDRFMYQKELFANDRELFFDSLETLNNLNNFDEALEFIVSHFDWDFEDETTGRFVALLNRRYK